MSTSVHPAEDHKAQVLIDFERPLADLGLARPRGSRARTTALASLAKIAAAFAALTLPLGFVGDAENPAYEQLRKAGQPVDIAVLGDSRPHTGISPTELARGLSELGIPGVRAWNFASNGTDAVHALSFARNGLFRQERAPKIVLWGTNPLQFDESRDNNRLEYLTASDLAPLWRAGAPRELLLDVGTMAVFPPWRKRPLLHKWIASRAASAGGHTIPLQAKALGLRFEEEVKERTRRYVAVDDGQTPYEVLEWKERYWSTARSYVGKYKRLEVSEWHMRCARELLRKARERGARVVVVEMPVSPWYQKELAASPKHQDWRSRMRAMADEEGAVFWNHSALYSSSDELFGDPGHMPRSLASVYSAELARRIAADPALSQALLPPPARAIHRGTEQ